MSYISPTTIFERDLLSCIYIYIYMCVCVCVCVCVQWNGLDTESGACGDYQWFVYVIIRPKSLYALSRDIEYSLFMNI